MTSNRPLANLLGWAEPEFLMHAEQKPMLALRLLTAPPSRLHLIAFAMSTAARPTTARLLEDTLTLPTRAILVALGVGNLRGLRRTLRRIPGAVLEPEEYRQIVSLLSDPTAAPLLHHAPQVTPALLANLAALPGPLRSHVLVRALGPLEGAADALVEWTRLVAERGSSHALSAIQRLLGNAGSFLELKACLAALTDSLPALEGPPSPIIGRAIRIDQPSAIRDLGRQFRNCLDSFVDVEVDGTSHIYHWRSHDTQAICEIKRVGNVGWFLGSHLGSQNEELAPEIKGAISADFRAAGIRDLRVAAIYDDLYFARGRYEPPEGLPEYSARDRLRLLD